MRNDLRIFKEEKFRRYLLEKHRLNPLCWLEDKLGESSNYFKWSNIDGYDDHKWDGDIDPLASIWNSIADVYKHISCGVEPEYRFFGIESATGTSKTFWLARLVLWFLDCFPDSLVVTSAPKQDQLALNLWSEISLIIHKFKKLRPNAELYKLRLVVDGSDAKVLDDDEVFTGNSWQAVGYVSGVGTEEQSAGKVRGFHRKNMLIILEEATSMSNAVLNAFQNTCTGEHNIIVAVGNPDSEHDPLHKFVSQKNVKSVRISALDYPNVVLGRELFSGAVTRVSIKGRADTYGTDSNLYNAMVRGICPTQSLDSLIKLEWIKDCIISDVSEYVNCNSFGSIGIDVSNSEAGDKASVAYGKDCCLMDLYEFQCPNATHLAYNVVYDNFKLDRLNYHNFNLPTIEDFKVPDGYIGVDAVGVGVATVNAFIDIGVTVQALQGGIWDEAIPYNEDGKPMYKFSSLRSQMYWELREDLRKGQVKIAITDQSKLEQIQKELTAPKFVANGTMITIEKKDDIKKRLSKSPNVADAIVYWNWVRKGYHVSNTIDLPFLGG